MRKKEKLKEGLLCAVFVLLLICSPVFAANGSLWSDNSSLFADQKASRVGDILTVRVVEHLDTSDEGKTNSSKNADGSVGDGENTGGTGLLSFIRALGFGSVSTYQGNAKSERTLDTGTTLSCLVVEVLPNGNLKIQGDRQIVTHAERMTMRFSGVVRPIDIAQDNVVPSNKVANAELVMTGRGTVTRTQRPGVITQVLQAIF